MPGRYRSRTGRSVRRSQMSGSAPPLRSCSLLVPAGRSPQMSPQPVSDWFWTWGVCSFGWIDGDALFTHDGRHVGYVEPADEEVLIFAIADGRYLGEIRDWDRLITKESRLDRSRLPRRERRQRRARVRRDRTARAMRAGHRDFPEPETV